eukprot:2107588-Rhodomonas_salina.1
MAWRGHRKGGTGTWVDRDDLIAAWAVSVSELASTDDSSARNTSLRAKCARRFLCVSFLRARSDAVGCSDLPGLEHAELCLLVVKRQNLVARLKTQGLKHATSRVRGSQSRTSPLS